jgi:hypothetical protein
MGGKRTVLALSAAVAAALAAGAAGAAPAAADGVADPVGSGPPLSSYHVIHVRPDLVSDNPCGGQMIHDCKPR